MRRLVCAAALAAAACSGSSIAPAPPTDAFLRLVEALVERRDTLDQRVRARPISGRTGEVTGSVRELGSEQAVANVRISFEGLLHTALTDSAGRFTLTGVPPGSGALSANLIGYRRVTVPLSIPEEGATIVDIGLEPHGIIDCEIVVTAGMRGVIRIRTLDEATGERPDVPVTLRVSDGVDAWTAVSDGPIDGSPAFTMAGEGRGPFVVEISANGYEPWRSTVPRFSPVSCPRWEREVSLARAEG